MQVTKNITLDLLETGSPVIIKAKQNDRNTRYIAAHLYVGRLDYQVPSGTEIAFRYKKPDGTAGFYDALQDNSPAITVSGNTVTVELVEQVLTVAGCVHCEINMYNAASEKLTTFTFEISVEESVLTDAEIISSDYYNVLTAEIAKALQAVTDATEQAENAAQSAQDAADSAAMSKDWAAGQPVTYSGTPVSIAYAGAQRIASITAYGENAQGGTTEAPVALTGISSVTVNDDVTELPIPRPLRRVGDVRDVCQTRVKSVYDKRIVLDGTEKWSEYTDENWQGAGYHVYRFYNADALLRQPIVSNKYPSRGGSSSFKGTLGVVSGGQSILFSVVEQKTLDDWKAYLAAQKKAGTPVIIYRQSTAYDGTNGLDVCLTEYMTGYIESYADESITTAWISSTGALSTGAEVAYVLSSPETYATDPVDFDNAAGPLTVMTGGELEVRMTELVGNREFTERLSYIGNPNLLDNSNFTNPVNQRDGTSYSASTGNTVYAIDRWRIEGATYTVATHTLSGTSYTNRACRMAQFIEMEQYGLAIGDTLTFSLETNGTKHSATAKILDRDQYSNFESVPSAYSCADFDVVLCTGLSKPSILSFTICPKKALVLEWAKLEKGSVATPYVHKSYGAELSACQRYFYYLDATKWYACYQITGWGLIIPIDLPVPMRAQPTANTVGEVKVFTPSGWVNATSMSTNQFNRDKARINIVLTMPSGSMDSYEGRAMVATGIESLSADL
nr:MAG TPA: tail fiber protein [Caudoviricetes sp.]